MRVKVSTVQRDAARRLIEIAREEGQPVDALLEAIGQAVPRPETPADAPPQRTTSVREWARFDGVGETGGPPPPPPGEGLVVLAVPHPAAD